MDSSVPQSASSSCALDCCECGAVVGTEGPQRGTLLLPCQHVLHMGCVEFVKRRGKMMMGMDSADVAEDGGDGYSSASSAGHHSRWAREMHGRCLCPACYAPITHIIPLYLRSEDDPSTTEMHVATVPNAAATVAATEEDYRRVHAAQKRVLLRLRGLCEQRRRMTDLTRTCAGLHERRARLLADVQKEERCFPGLLSEGESGGAATVSASSSGNPCIAPSSSPSLPTESMGITELELYMAQLTPRLLRTQAEVRKERQLVERRTKKLNALRSHYHYAKELHALNVEIAARQERLHGGPLPAPSSDRPNTPPADATSPRLAVRLSVDALAPEPQQSAPAEATRTGLETPARKRMRGEETINVDEEPDAVVVEVLSCDASDSDELEVTVVGDDVHDVDSAVTAAAEDAGEDDASLYDAPYLIPCYVRTSTSGTATAADPKMPHTALTHNHVRMLPRREDRLWQPSLQF